MASAPGHPSQALPRSLALEVHRCCPWKCGNCNLSAPPRAGIFSLPNTSVFSPFANIPSTPNGDLDRPATPVPPISPGIAEPKRSAPTSHRPVTPITPIQSHLAEPKWSATTVNRPATLGQPKLQPPLAEPTRPATIHRPVTPGKPKPSQTLLEALKASAVTRCWPATLGLPILGQTLLAALKSSSAARHWPVTFGQPIIAQTLPAKPKSSAPKVHQPGTSITIFPSQASTKRISSPHAHLIIESTPRHRLRLRRKRTRASNIIPPVRRAEDRRHVPPAPSGPAPWSTTYQGVMTGQHAVDCSPSPGGAQAHHASRPQAIHHGRTHLSSGAHLSAEFKDKTSAAAKPEMAEAVRQFDAWSKRWGVGKLLEQRLAAKELKKANEASERVRKPYEEKYPSGGSTTKNDNESRARSGNSGLARTSLPATGAGGSGSSEDELNHKKLKSGVGARWKPKGVVEWCWIRHVLVLYLIAVLGRTATASSSQWLALFLRRGVASFDAGFPNPQ